MREEDSRAIFELFSLNFVLIFKISNVWVVVINVILLEYKTLIFLPLEPKNVIPDSWG